MTGERFPAGRLDSTTIGIFADALADPCLILDRRSLVVHRNQAAAEQFPGVLVGRPLAFVLRHPSLLSAVEAARRTGLSQTIELHQTVPNETWHRVTVAPLLEAPLGEDELAPVLVLTLQNQTEARRIDALRTDFIANASHELRTPLASLIGFIDTLLGPAAKDAEAAKRLADNARQGLEKLIAAFDDPKTPYRAWPRPDKRPRYSDYTHLARVLEWLPGAGSGE